MRHRGLAEWRGSFYCRRNEDSRADGSQARNEIAILAELKRLLTSFLLDTTSIPVCYYRAVDVCDEMHARMLSSIPSLRAVLWALALANTLTVVVRVVIALNQHGESLSKCGHALSSRPVSRLIVQSSNRKRITLGRAATILISFLGNVSMTFL